MQPAVDKSFAEKMRLIHDGLTVVWNAMIDRFQIFHKDQRSGITRLILTVEDDDGSYRPCDMRTLIYLSELVAWDLLDKFPSPKDLYQHFKSKKENSQLKKRTEREEYRKWWNKEHRREWKAALENARRGIFYIPEEHKRKIFVH